MLRFSEKDVQPSETLEASGHAFLLEASKRLGPAPWIVLAGGSDLRSIRVRLAQTFVRYDERPSPWSHCGVVLDVRPDDPSRSTGAHVSLRPSPAAGPERNYVDFFELGHYADARKFPNLALVSVESKSAKPAEFIALAKDRALREHPARGVHAFGPMLAAWNAHLYDPTHFPNPLTNGVPFPAAAYVDYVFAGARIDITPAAASSAINMEQIWASVRHFPRDDVKFTVVMRKHRAGLAFKRAPGAKKLAHAYKEYRDKR